MSTAVSADVLALLTLPALDGLSERQLRGAACVWNGVALSPATAVDLGAHTAARADDPAPRYLRACRHCVAHQAHRALLDHGSTCELCALHETAGQCAIGRGLYRLVREYR